MGAEEEVKKDKDIQVEILKDVVRPQMPGEIRVFFLIAWLIAAPP